MRTRGILWLIGAFLICPCHLPLTLGLAATLLAGTALGAAVRGHPVVAGIVLSLAFGAAMWRAIHLLNRATDACARRPVAKPDAGGASEP